MKASLRAQEEIIDIYNRYSDMIYRITFLYLKNSSESEDALQNVFLKFIRYDGKFDSEEHLKAWLIVTAKNVCKDMLKNFWRKNRISLEQTAQHPYTDLHVHTETYQTVMTLHPKYRIPLYLYYYEGYSTAEISELLGINHSTVRSRLHTARKKLKLAIEEDRKDG